MVKLRVEMLTDASNLAKVPTDPPVRRHQLSGNRKGQFAVDLTKSHRLVLEPNHDPVPLKADGGIDLAKVEAITILEVVNYH